MDKLFVIIGQIIGIVAMAIFFISYQAKEPKKLLALQCVAISAMCLHYFFIGAMSGFVLNAIGLIRNICYANRDKKFLSGKWLPIFFAVLIGVVGILFWESYYSVFIIIGLVINTLCLAIPDTQKVRASVLITCPLVFTYDVFVFSIGGMSNEAISFTSAAIGLIRLRKSSGKTSK